MRNSFLNRKMYVVIDIVSVLPMLNGIISAII